MKSSSYQNGRVLDQDELELLTLEISEIQSAIRELSQQMRRIERLVKAVLPQPPKQSISDHRQHLDGITAKQAINRLVEQVENGGQIQNALRNMTVKNELAVIASELGMTNTKLPAKDELIRRISTRIRQQVVVAKGLRAGLQDNHERVD